MQLALSLVGRVQYVGAAVRARVAVRQRAPLAEVAQVLYVHTAEEGVIDLVQTHSLHLQALIDKISMRFLQLRSI